MSTSSSHAFAGGLSANAKRGPEGPLFELQPQGAGVVIGGAVTLQLVNVGDAALKHLHPAAGSSCGQFRWSVRLVAADGTVYDRDYDGPDRACLTVLVPAQDLTFEPGEVATKVTVDTSRPFFVRGNRPTMGVRPQAKQLPAGRYTVIVSGAGIQARAMLSITSG